MELIIVKINNFIAFLLDQVQQGKRGWIRADSLRLETTKEKGVVP